MDMISSLIDLIFNALYLMLFVRVILSWLPINPYNSIIELMNIITDPLLRPFQNILPPYKFGLDLSPFFAGIALMIFRYVILYLFGI